jgi:hypothetical protein
VSAPTPLAWGTVSGTRGSRVHALITLDFINEAACGQPVDGFVMDEEPDWNADVPVPFVLCPKCKKELGR